MDTQFIDLTPPNPSDRYYCDKMTSTSGWSHLMKLVLMVKKNPEAMMIIKSLIIDKNKLSKYNNAGQTALMIACANSNTYSNIETVKMLIDAGADVNFRNNRNITALFKSCQYSNTSSNVETVKMLIDAGADVNVTELIFGYTPLIMSCEINDVETAKMLIESGADVNTMGCN